ncbi:MAG: hypothetical protein Q4Q07_01470 [Tissierellia bacterium]|nr:hypothetical protein [Tissierellia bacterium]
MNNYYIFNNIFKVEYISTIFSDIIEKGKKFIVHFPGTEEIDSENPQERGKEEFLNLENVQIGSSEYMKEGIKIVGDLNLKSKNLFYQYFSKASINGRKEGLYHFSIHNEENMIFEIQNFCIGYILCNFYNESEQEDLGLHQYEKFIL